MPRISTFFAYFGGRETIAEPGSYRRQIVEVTGIVMPLDEDEGFEWLKIEASAGFEGFDCNKNKTESRCKRYNA